MPTPGDWATGGLLGTGAAPVMSWVQLLMLVHNKFLGF